MSLRVKVEVALFVVVGLLISLSYTTQRYVILPQLDPLEEKVAQRDMDRCVEAIEREIASIDSACAECAALREIRESALGAPPKAGGERLVAERSLEFLFVLDSKGHTVWRSVSEPRSQFQPLVEELPEYVWAASPPTAAGPAELRPVSGVLMGDSGPALIAAHPITADDGQPIACLVAGRLLDQALLTRIARQTAVSFQVWPTNDPVIPDDVRAVIDDIAEKELLHVSHVTENLFRVYRVYPDILGTPALLFQADVHRDVLARAYNTLQTGLLAQVGLGLAALGVLIILFRLGVMNPLSRLTAHTTNLRETNNLSSRLALDRKDEIGTLANEFDAMVGRLEEDMESQRRVEEALRESEERYMLAVKGANDGLWDWDLVCNRMYFSLRWKTMLGYTEDEIDEDPENWLGRVHPEERDHVSAALDAHLKGETAHFESEHRVRHKDASYIWVLTRGLAVRDEEGKPTRMAGSQADVTARKIIEEQLSHQALHDSLTALPNRALFLDRLSQALRHSQRHTTYMFAVLFLDLDRFKVINDGLGHMIGDKLLTSLAERLNGLTRLEDTLARNEGTIARFGGDEFVILLDNITDVSDATLVAERILESFKQPFQVDEHEIFTTASIGIALSATGHKTAEEILRSADTAMYRAKARGKACYEVYDTDMHSRAVARLQVETDLRRAIEREEFIVHYQPIVSLTSGRVEAFEALVRWEHPERGLVSPLEFIPVAEETGMIVDIGERVMRAACRQTRAWQIKLPHAKDLRISVNLSVKEFGKLDLLEGIEQGLLETGLDPKFLKLEVTESAILENVDYVTGMLGKLRAMGIELSIDDFGTGYSSLSYLHRLPMNTLKIDRAFVRDMETSPESLQIVKTIILLAQALEMDVIAEGIESEYQLATLRGLNCEYGQGYLFAKPLDAEAATALLRDNPSWLPGGAKEHAGHASER